MTGGAYSLSSLYPADRFEVTGEPVRGGLGTGPTHMFCGKCMSWMYTVPESLEAFVNVRSSLFNDAAEHRPFMETHRREGFDWALIGAPRAFESVPQDDEFEELITAYGEWDGRVKQ